MVERTPLGIVGAGTMGSGIALAALLSDIPVILYEIAPQVQERATEYINAHLIRKHKAINQKYLHTTVDLEELTRCQVVVEAIPESLDLKQALFARLDLICPPPAILATNTSTLSVTAIASATQTPHRVAGLHFFNPAAVMPLVEVVQAAQTSAETLQGLYSLAGKMGKIPVIARDTPGFIVNRVARPFYGEALRMLGEGVASHEQIDRIVRQGAGFRMGPFELMDLIGIDVNLAATQSIYEQTFQEPRYRPHRIQASMVAQRALGRKTGRGFYQYDTNQSPTDNSQPILTNSQSTMAGKVLITPGKMAPGMEENIRNFLTVTNDPRDPALQLVVVTAGQAEGLKETLRSLSQSLPGNTPILCQCGDITLAESSIWVEKPHRLAGLDGLFFAQGDVATLVAHPKTSPETCAAVEEFVIHCGRSPMWVEDSPGLVLPRIVSALANEAAFALGEGVADAATIDQAMQLGTNYPKGPLSWAKELGYTQMIAVLDFLHAEFGEERYRIAPLLRQWARWELESTSSENHH